MVERVEELARSASKDAVITVNPISVMDDGDMVRNSVLNSGTVRLGEVAHARSGDKGNHANVGVIAYTAAGFEFLGQVLTETRVAEFFLPLRPRRVERFELPGIGAYNFVLSEVLAGGASRSLRIDSQGKVLALAMLELELPRPANLDEMRQAVGGKQ